MSPVAAAQALCHAGAIVVSTRILVLNHAGRGWGIRKGKNGAVRLPKILVLIIGASALPRRGTRRR